MRMLLRFCRICPALLSTLVCGSAAWAQTRAARVEVEPPPAFGSVTGHVYLSGSNAPARFARVALQPLEVKDPPQASPGKMMPPSFTVYQTDLEGAFRIDHVKPGAYYVVVNAPGCMSPFALFSKEELQTPSPEVARRIAATVPAVSVAENATANVTIQVKRGASLSGNVRFDDGTPFAEAWISVDKRGPDGKWSRPRATEAFASSDTEGHWRVEGLPPGVYRIKADLTVQERHQSALLGDNSSSWNNSVMSVPVYLGDTIRERDAKTVTIEDGQQAQGQDILVPVSKMHTVTGAVVDARTGQAMNAGRVALVYPDDDKEITSVPIDPDTQRFTMPFVPEGEYKLTTKDAHQARFEQSGDPNNDPFHQNRKEITLREYKPADMPLVIQGDMEGVNLAVQPKAAKAQ